MANPPEPVPPPATDVVTHGTILSFGLDGLSVTGILIDSYKRDAKFANMDEIQNQMGEVTGLRFSDYRVDISVSGRILTTASPTVKVGSTFTVNGDTGVITDLGMGGEAKGFAKLDIKAVCYSKVSGLVAS
jgi:hypothetical protein